MNGQRFVVSSVLLQRLEPQLILQAHLKNALGNLVDIRVGFLRPDVGPAPFAFRWSPRLLLFDLPAIW